MRTIASSPRSPRRSTRSAPGRMVIVVDDADRENEGDLIMAAEKVTPEAIAFMVRHTSGVICMPVVGRAARRARDPADGGRQHRLAADRVHRVGRLRGAASRRGSRAADRARTIRAVIDPDDRARGPVAAGSRLPAALPGRRRPKRAGHTEAAVDLARLAGLYPGRRPVRDRQRRRDDGAAAGPGAVRPGARAEDHLDRRPDRVPAPARGARDAGGGGHDPHRATASSARSPTRAWSTGGRTSPW